jgi:hypothetical protein
VSNGGEKGQKEVFFSIGETLIVNGTAALLPVEKDGI